MADSARFWNRIARRYAASPISDDAAYQRKLATTQKHLRREMHALEFGCGTGGTALKHAPLVASYRAIDISGNMLEIARDRAGAEMPESLSFEVADFDALELAPESLDAILALSILHLVPDPATTITKVYRSLKPGGVFVSSTSCAGAMRILRLIAPLGHAIGLLPTLSFFTEDDLRAMIRDAGFEIVEDWQPEGSGKALFLVARKGG